MLVRLKFAKTTEGRFLSHLDLLRTMERSLRRARLPLAFSEGFNPHPRVAYGPALAVGVTSDGEYLDVELQGDMELSAIRERLDAAMPPGLKVLDLKKIAPGTGSLNAVINLARYRVEIPLAQKIDENQIKQAVSLIMEQPELVVTRYGKKGPGQVDIKTGIYSLNGTVEDGKIIVEMDLLTGGQGSVKPEEVVELLHSLGGLQLEPHARIHRLGLYIREGKGIKSPLEA